MRISIRVRVKWEKEMDNSWLDIGHFKIDVYGKPQTENVKSYSSADY